MLAFQGYPLMQRSVKTSFFVLAKKTNSTLESKMFLNTRLKPNSFFLEFKRYNSVNSNETKEGLSAKPSTLRKVAKNLTCTDAVTEETEKKTDDKEVFEIKYKDQTIQSPLTFLSVKDDPVQLKKLLNAYLQLSKPRLTILVMLSAICSYALSPLAASVPTLISLTLGTSLASASANAINMGREPEFDSKMQRTLMRPVVKGILTSKQAYQFSAVTGALGTAILYFGVNPTVALLGVSNIVLYSWIYTSLKRKHIINTWVGALVGGIPPLMGWCASSSILDPAAWCLAALLYCWQFPHFNTLSHNIKQQYKEAGYVMTAWKNPMLNARVSLRYALLMIPLCVGLSYYNVCDWYYSVDSTLINLWLSYWAFKFYFQQRINYKSPNKNFNTEQGIIKANLFAKKCFWVSVLHLPLILILAILHRKGRWDFLFEDDGKSEERNVLN
ncbi:hypothetical protein QEN19_001423 [Hanseniaspora menglaensis]